MFDHDLQTLRLFVVAVEERNLSRAAERMGIAISAASRRIRIFEEALGDILFKRLAHGLEPTPAGMTALQYAREVLRLSQQVGANVADHAKGVRGRVRVFASSSALVQRLAADLSRFAIENPEIKLDLEEQPTLITLEALQRNQAQLGVVVRGFSSSRLTTYPYIKDRLVLAVPKGHRFCDRSSVRFSEVLGEDLVSLDASTATYRLIAERALEIGLFPKHRVQVRSFEVMCQMVRHGLGVGILPEQALLPLTVALDIALVALDEAWAARHLDICIPASDAPDPPTARLIEALLQS